MTTHLGNRTDETRKLRADGMSVADIADKFGVSKATIYNDLKGARVKRKGSEPTAKPSVSNANTVRVSINNSFAVSSNVSSERVKQILGLLID